MNDESYVWFVIGLFLAVVGLIGIIFCSRFIAIEFSTGMLSLLIVMLMICIFGILMSAFEVLLELLDWLLKFVHKKSQESK